MQNRVAKEYVLVSMLTGSINPSDHDSSVTTALALTTFVLFCRERSARIASMYSAVIKLSNENVMVELPFE